MEKVNFLNIMAEWNYAIENYSQELPWQILAYNYTERKTLTVNAIEAIHNGLKIIADEETIIISPTSPWRLKHGRTAKYRIIFTQNLA